ncbi:MAG: hypothetical protein WA003_01775 [Desulfuromonadaceae bacterium]
MSSELFSFNRSQSSARTAFATASDNAQTVDHGENHGYVGAAG